MNRLLLAGFMVSSMLLASTVLADDLLGKKGGGGNSGSGGGSSNGGNSGGGNSGGNRGGNRNDPPPVRGGGDRGSSNSGNVRFPTPDRGQRQRTDDNLTGKRPTQASSRSGKVSYGSSSNVAGRPEGRQTFDVMPQVNAGRVPRDTNNQPQIRRGQGNEYTGGYRSGYYHYNNNWRDDWFWYPHYGFRWDPVSFVPSPWYHYSHLPAYISIGRVVIVFNGPVIYDTCSRRYDYRPINVGWGWNSGRDDWNNNGWGGDWNDGWRDNDWDRRSELSQSADDIIMAFRRGSVRPMSGLVPNRGRILIDLGDGARYTLDSDDYYDLMQDLVEGTRSTNYRIRDVRTSDDGDYAMVAAQHEFRNSWGGVDRTTHVFGLERDRRGYVIREFSIRRG